MELGSNFELNPNAINYCNNNIKTYLSDQYTVFTDSGRSALKLIGSKIKKGKILVPTYICKSVVDSLKESHEICFYPLNSRLEIDKEGLEKSFHGKVTAIYIMHYFGKLQDEKILSYISELKRKYGIFIIEDVTHSLLTEKSTIGDVCVCSLRKWFPIPDGGVLYSKNRFDIKDDFKSNDFSAEITEAMIMKYLHINEKVECNAFYRKRFIEAENRLDCQNEIFRISEMAELLLKCLNLDEITEKRKKNWNAVLTGLSNDLIKPFWSKRADDFTPFTFPVLVKDRDRFREYLIQKNIFCAVHWPIETDEQKKDGNSVSITNHILSLPIDQRYDDQHIQYMLNVINMFR